ncbi:unnamed protein product [Candidula unifasciata]|uniref:Cation-dependent mannose-6-phosphate receptor n=1 Tax=Candidula unifasciata TaxID=100452 RepID=A0A8S3ZAB8_9EUPU|nr:unnamed protein product [Candidula unifasciata]
MGIAEQFRFGARKHPLSISIVCITLFHVVVGEFCYFNTDPCICQTNTFELNLKPLMDAMRGADFVATVEEDFLTYIYYVQPCNRRLSSQIAPCTNVDSDLVSCQQLQSSTMAFGLGVVGSFEATKVQDDYVLTNSFRRYDDTVTRQLQLTIKCSDQEAAFSYQGNSGPIFSPIVYRFALLTKYICSGGGGGDINISVEVGISAGSIMVIIFFVVIAVYFVGGLLFQKFVRNAQGTDIIPNVSFWAAIPSLAKDGVLFLVRGCKGGASYTST